jgi:hypothetical protein
LSEKLLLKPSEPQNLVDPDRNPAKRLAPNWLA